MADTYNLPLLAEMCDRIQIIRMTKVIKYAEFLQLSEMEVIKYLKKCEEYSENSGNALLGTALSWMSKNKVLWRICGAFGLNRFWRWC